MTAMFADGDEAPNVTEHHHYLLPPKIEGRFEPQFNGWHQYKLPHPKTGRPTGFSRATTIAKTLDDTHNVHRWEMRNELLGLSIKALDEPEKFAALARDVRDNKLNKNELDREVELADVAGGGAEAREFGTAVHAWLEYVDHGLILPSRVPEMYRPHVYAYLAALARNGLVALPEYTERIVLDSKNKIAGMIDRVYLQADGSLALGDVKTSKTLEYGYLTYSTQLKVYHGADYMLSLDGTHWEEMPEFVPDYAILMHCPSDDPDGSAAVTFDMAVGKRGLELAMAVREIRKSAKKDVPNTHAMPIPSAEYAAQQAAVLAIRTLSDPDDLAAIWEQYEDVWNDDLTGLGNAVAEDLTK